jgi:hypothetical protein
MAGTNILEFIERAKAGGASEQAVVGMLTARGWPEKEVYEALAAHYERVTGMEIPRRGASGTAAKDAFFHLLMFWTLATWTFGWGALAFLLIEHWLPDRVTASPYNQGFDLSFAAWAMAAMIVAFPIFLLVSRSVLRAERAHPEKLNAPLRKWLWYLVLVIAAAVFIGDLIAVLTRFLSGEVTALFLGKASVVLVLSGGVFFYYFGRLRRSEDSDTQVAGSLVVGSRDRWMALFSGLVVVALLIPGFWFVGAPGRQRALRADQKRLQDIDMVSGRIRNVWNASHKLPERLDQLPEPAPADPVSGAGYEYRVKAGSQYELCATFAKASLPNDLPQARIWTHPAGRYCFSLDATSVQDSPYPYFPMPSD